MADVLVVDDNEDVRDAMATLLKVAGHRPTTARDGRAALLFLAEAANPPDIIFLDLDMPVMNGRAFLREYRASTLRQVPVVVVTGSSDLSGLDEEAVLRKPVVPRAILELVERAHLLKEEPRVTSPPAIPDA